MGSFPSSLGLINKMLHAILKKPTPKQNVHYLKSLGGFVGLFKCIVPFLLSDNSLMDVSKTRALVLNDDLTEFCRRCSPV